MVLGSPLVTFAGRQLSVGVLATRELMIRGAGSSIIRITSLHFLDLLQVGKDASGDARQVIVAEVSNRSGSTP